MRYFLSLFILVSFSSSQVLQIPDRKSDAPTGSQLYTTLVSLSRSEREDTIFTQFANGNIPNFLRHLIPISIRQSINDREYSLVYFVTPDYLALGVDSDYVLMPMTPILAQKIANFSHCILPTQRMVDQIYTSSEVKLRPQPIPPDADMDKIPRFYQHNDSVKSLRGLWLKDHPLGALVGGTKKDVIIDNKISTNLKKNVPKPVVIYGWHMLDGHPIQPAYNGHGATYADYSHGIRLVQKIGMINGAEISLSDLLLDPIYYPFISDTVLVATSY